MISTKREIVFRVPCSVSWVTCRACEAVGTNIASSVEDVFKDPCPAAASSRCPRWCPAVVPFIFHFCQSFVVLLLFIFLLKYFIIVPLPCAFESQPWPLASFPQPPQPSSRSWRYSHMCRIYVFTSATYSKPRAQGRFSQRRPAGRAAGPFPGMRSRGHTTLGPRCGRVAGASTTENDKPRANAGSQDGREAQHPLRRCDAGRTGQGLYAVGDPPDCSSRGWLLQATQAGLQTVLRFAQTCRLQRHVPQWFGGIGGARRGQRT